MTEIAKGLGKPDSSAFLLIRNDGNLFLHSAADGKLLAQSDRYSVGGPARFSPNGDLVGWSNLNEASVYDWQNAEFVLQQPHSAKMSDAFTANFAAGNRLVVSTVTTNGGRAEEVWDITGGQLETLIDGLLQCRADEFALYLLCAVPASNSQRILELDNPERIVFTNNDPFAFTSISPAGNGYVTCTTGGNSITYKTYAPSNTTLNFPCQAATYSADGVMLLLQSGEVLSLPAGEVLLTLKLDENELAFGRTAPYVYFGAEAPATYFGSDFIAVNNKVFDAASGELLVELPMSTVWGLAMSGDGLTLNALTPQGIEQWQVTQ